MIKFTLLALLCFSLGNEILARFEEDKVGSDGYRLEVSYNDGNCCKDLKDPNESPEDEPVCLNSKNSQLISDQTLVVLKRAESSYDSIKALRIPEFMIGAITYQEWADNILFGNYNFDGFAKLKQLVSKYVLCKKVCKVFFFLRQALREHTATAEFDNTYETVFVTETESYDLRFLKVSGDLIVLGDVRKDIELNFQVANDDGEPFAGVVFEAETMIIDSHLLENKGWAGKFIRIDVNNVIVPRNYGFYVGGNPGEWKFKIHNLRLFFFFSLFNR